MAISENFASLLKFIGVDLGDPDIQSYLSTCDKNATCLSNVSVNSIVGAFSDYLEEITVTKLKIIDSFALLSSSMNPSMSSLVQLGSSPL